MDYYNEEEKRLVIKAESIIGDKTLWKDNNEMKNSFRISDDKLNVEDLLVLLGSIRRRQLTLALSCFDLTKKKTGKDKIKHFLDTVEMIKNDFEGADFDDVLDSLPELRRIHDSLHRELFEGRVSDAVHMSNNEREIAKYKSESNVATAKYNSESNVATAKYNSESNVATAKYKSESNVATAKYKSESNVATAKYNSESNVATAKYNCESKTAIQCTMMRSDCPVDADTQKSVLELTRLMYTSYSSPNRSQSNQPYQYPPNPLPMHTTSPYPPHIGFNSPNPPQYEPSSYPPQYGSAPHRSNGQKGAMNYPFPPY